MSKLKWILLSEAYLPLLLIVAITVGGGFRARADENVRVVQITAKRFEFVPSTVTLKKGEKVRLHLTSEDVVHGFFSKPLGLDEVIAPGKATDVTITPQTAGTFTTICDHFCGSGHGNMHMTFVVE